MADTLQNISIDAEEWINIYPLASIDAGTPVSIQNTGVSDLYYSISETKPPRNSDKYKIFRRSDTIDLTNNDLFVWVFSPQVDGLINVSLFVSNIEDLLNSLLNTNIKLTKMLAEQNGDILLQLKLLNARFEEMANTRIIENDIGG